MKKLNNVKSFLKRFFEPAFLAKKNTIKLFIESSLGSLWFDILPLLSIPFLINLLEAKNYKEVYLLALAIFIFYIFIWILHFYIRSWDMRAKLEYEIALNTKYREQFLLKNSLELEKVGTGKIQSIIQKGMNAWVMANWEILYQIPKIILTLLFGIYLTYSLGFYYFLLFVFLCIISVTGFTYFKKIKLVYDKEINDLSDEVNANSVRAIMSRHEIVSSNNVSLEISKINNLCYKQSGYINKSEKYDFMSDLFISSLGVLLPFGGIALILYFGDAGNISSGLLLSFVYFSSRFSFMMYSFVYLIRNLVDKYPEIKKLWKFLDETPELMGYDTGLYFIHKGGEIELRSIDFTYER